MMQNWVYPKKPPLTGETVEAPVFDDVFSSAKIEVSLKDWHRNWMHLERLTKSQLKKFAIGIEYIQRHNVSGMRAMPTIKVIPASRLKKVEYKEDYQLYEMKLGGQGSTPRVFFKLTYRHVDGESKPFVHILWLDCNHEICS